jgi:hypothetical protein
LARLRWNHSKNAAPENAPATKRQTNMPPAAIHSNDASGPPRTEEVKATRSLQLSAELAAYSKKMAAIPNNRSGGALDGLGRRIAQRQIVHKKTNTAKPGMAKIIAGEVMPGLSR